MKRLIATVLAGFVLGSGAAEAQDWQMLDGQGIAEALTDRVLVYERARQSFFASGRTSYDSGREEWGYWRVDGDQYCSQWPPADGWACYRMQASSNGALKFIGDSGAETIGTYAE